MKGKKAVGTICAIAVWFSLVVGHSVEGAQVVSEFSAGTATVVAQVGGSSSNGDPVLESGVSQPNGELAMDSSSQITIYPETSMLDSIPWGAVASVVASVGVVLICYNLITARKNGWGWWVLTTLGIAIVFAGRMGASLFCEISSDATGVPDWDED